MKNFLITLFAVLIGATLVLMVHDHFVVRPREAALLQRMSVPPDLVRMRVEAREVAAGVEASVRQSVEVAREALDSQALESDRRALVQDAMARASMFRVSLSESYMNLGRWPDNVEEIGLPAPADTRGGAVREIVVGKQGRVSVVLDERFAQGSVIELTPAVDGATWFIDWACEVRGDPVLKRALTQCR